MIRVQHSGSYQRLVNLGEGKCSTPATLKFNMGYQKYSVVPSNHPVSSMRGWIGQLRNNDEIHSWGDFIKIPQHRIMKCFFLLYVWLLNFQGCIYPVQHVTVSTKCIKSHTKGKQRWKPKQSKMKQNHLLKRLNRYQNYRQIMAGMWKYPMIFKDTKINILVALM